MIEALKLSADVAVATGSLWAPQLLPYPEEGSAAAGGLRGSGGRVRSLAAYAEKIEGVRPGAHLRAWLTVNGRQIEVTGRVAPVSRKRTEGLRVSILITGGPPDFIRSFPGNVP